jgi:hypothetical protein
MFKSRLQSPYWSCRSWAWLVQQAALLFKHCRDAFVAAPKLQRLANGNKPGQTLIRTNGVEQCLSHQRVNRRRNRTNNRNHGIGTFTITTANMSSPLCSIGPRQSFEHRPRHVRFDSQ